MFDDGTAINSDEDMLVVSTAVSTKVKIEDGKGSSFAIGSLVGFLSHVRWPEDFSAERPDPKPARQNPFDGGITLTSRRQVHEHGT